jgi:hypothetical protein
MAKLDDVFPSKFLKGGDLSKPITLTIERTPLEPLKSSDGKEQIKTVLYFVGAKKGLVLNKTNWCAIADITGDDDSDNWPGHKIELYPTKTQMGPKMVDAIRVRAPAQGVLLKQKVVAQEPPPSDDEPPPVDELPADDMNDVIPF